MQQHGDFLLVRFFISNTAVPSRFIEGDYMFILAFLQNSIEA